MSMIRCDRCSNLIDSDDDPDCFVDDPRHSIPPHPDRVLCEPCRDEQEDDGEISFKPLDQSLAELRAQEEMDTL